MLQERDTMLFLFSAINASDGSVTKAKIIKNIDFHKSGTKGTSQSHMPIEEKIVR